MSSICIIDTSIFTNILDVPCRNQEHAKIIERFEEYILLECQFILPMATVIETGNHIAQNGDGRTRRATAQRFVDFVQSALNNDFPWILSKFPSSQEILHWLNDFPDYAMRNKSAEKTGEGTSFGDLSIIQEFEKAKVRFSMTEVFIWSLDADLMAYHHLKN